MPVKIRFHSDNGARRSNLASDDDNIGLHVGLELALPGQQSNIKLLFAIYMASEHVQQLFKFKLNLISVSCI